MARAKTQHQQQRQDDRRTVIRLINRHAERNQSRHAHHAGQQHPDKIDRGSRKRSGKYRFESCLPIEKQLAFG